MCEGEEGEEGNEEGVEAKAWSVSVDRVADGTVWSYVGAREVDEVVVRRHGHQCEHREPAGEQEARAEVNNTTRKEDRQHILGAFEP